jgi:hypothetical protein
MTVHYKAALGGGPDYVTYSAAPPCTTAHMHVIPINPAGTIGVVFLLVAGLSIFILFDSRKTIPTRGL